MVDPERAALDAEIEILRAGIELLRLKKNRRGRKVEKLKAELAKSNEAASTLGELYNTQTANLRTAEAENARLREALTPSGETKAAYIAEFSFKVSGVSVYVPWTTIKEIMKAIRARAALGEKQ